MPPRPTRSRISKWEMRIPLRQLSMFGFSVPEPAGLH
jgi:hypothetical protein